MKQFKCSEVTRWEMNEENGARWISGRLVFPKGEDEDKEYFISVYRPDFTSAYECSLDMYYNGGEYTRRGLMKRDCASDEEIERFVNECFAYVKGFYRTFIVDGVAFRNLKTAEKHGKVDEIVYGPYDSERMYEFFEGNGEFGDEYE